MAGLWFGESTGAALLGLGLTLPGLLLQDSWRFAFFSAGKGRMAFVNDLTWAAALVPAMAVMVVSGHASVGWFMLAWGMSACFAAVVGAFQARLVPRPTESVQWLRQHRDLAIRYLGESLSLSSASQIRLYGLAAIAGLAAAGSLRAAELLLGPLNTAIMGIAMMAGAGGGRPAAPFDAPAAAVLPAAQLPGGGGCARLGDGPAPAARLRGPARSSTRPGTRRRRCSCRSRWLWPASASRSAPGPGCGRWARPPGAYGPGDRLGGLPDGGVRRHGDRRCRRRGLGLGRRDPDRGLRLVVGAPSGRAGRPPRQRGTPLSPRAGSRAAE